MSRIFSSSRLVRQLGAWPFLALESSRQDFAERLSLWISPVDAIALHAVQQTAAAPTGTWPPEAVTQVDALRQEVERVRAALQRSMSVTPERPTPASGGAGRLLGAPGEVDASGEAALLGARYRQWCGDRQRDMEARTSALRAQARRVLAGLTPRLRQLALLDAALERALGSREQKLLARLPGLLQRRFQQWQEAGGQVPPGAPLSAQSRSGHWEAGFRQEMQALLQAELQTRLEPVLGLVEAATREVKERQ